MKIKKISNSSQNHVMCAVSLSSMQKCVVSSPQLKLLLYTKHHSVLGNLYLHLLAIKVKVHSNGHHASGRTSTSLVDHPHLRWTICHGHISGRSPAKSPSHQPWRWFVFDHASKQPPKNSAYFILLLHVLNDI